MKRSVRPEAETAAAALLDWDSEFWGAPIGRVEGGALNREGLHAVDEWAATHGVACVYFLADSSDASSAHVAEDGGFRLMDLRVELRRPSAGDETTRELRPASPDDVGALRAIARASHGVTRFYADPHFPDDRCDDLYDTWITRSLEGWADGVLVAEAEGRRCRLRLLPPRSGHGGRLDRADRGRRGSARRRHRRHALARRRRVVSQTAARERCPS